MRKTKREKLGSAPSKRSCHVCTIQKPTVEVTEVSKEKVPQISTFRTMGSENLWDLTLLFAISSLMWDFTPRFCKYRSILVAPALDLFSFDLTLCTIPDLALLTICTQNMPCMYEVFFATHKQEKKQSNGSAFFSPWDYLKKVLLRYF